MPSRSLSYAKIVQGECRTPSLLWALCRATAYLMQIYIKIPIYKPVVIKNLMSFPWECLFGNKMSSPQQFFGLSNVLFRHNFVAYFIKTFKTFGKWWCFIINPCCRHITHPGEPWTTDGISHAEPNCLLWSYICLCLFVSQYFVVLNFQSTISCLNFCHAVDFTYFSAVRSSKSVQHRQRKDTNKIWEPHSISENIFCNELNRFRAVIRHRLHSVAALQVAHISTANQAKLKLFCG